MDFWCAVGEQMSIKNLLSNAQDWLIFQQQYEAEFMSYDEVAHELAIRSIDELVKQSAPLGLRSLAKQVIIATIDLKVQQCLDLPQVIIPLSVITGLLNSMRINFEQRKDIVYKPLA